MFLIELCHIYLRNTVSNINSKDFFNLLNFHAKNYDREMKLDINQIFFLKQLVRLKINEEQEATAVIFGSNSL